MSTNKITKKDRIAHLELQVGWLTEMVHELRGTENLEFEPQLKQLDQSVFDGLDEKWQFAAVDGCTGRAYVYEQKPHFFHGKDYWRIHEGLQCIIGHDYDASNWQNSLIERDTAELMGSDLCHEMLKRGDKAVMCKINESNNMTIIVGCKESKLGGWVFHSHRHANHYIVTPINNQGEPLTASEVGL